VGVLFGQRGSHGKINRLRISRETTFKLFPLVTTPNTLHHL